MLKVGQKVWVDLADETVVGTLIKKKGKKLMIRKDESVEGVELVITIDLAALNSAVEIEEETFAGVTIIWAFPKSYTPEEKERWKLMCERHFLVDENDYDGSKQRIKEIEHRTWQLEEPK